MAAVARRAPLSLGMWMATSPELVAGPRSQWPARYASRSAVRPWRPAPTSSSASASSGPFSVSSTVFPASSRRSDLRLSSFDAAMGSGMAELQYASCLDNLDHTEAGRAPPFHLDAIPLSKCAKYCTSPLFDALQFMFKRTGYRFDLRDLCPVREGVRLNIEPDRRTELAQWFLVLHPDHSTGLAIP